MMTSAPNSSHRSRSSGGGAGGGDITDAQWKSFAPRLHYHPADALDAAAYPGLIASINSTAESAGILKAPGTPNILFYLSVSPNLYEGIIANIGAAGLV